MKEHNCPGLVWEEEHKVLTLEGQPVLEYTLCWPQLQNPKGLSRRINWYYARLARQWRLRWQREIYWLACLELVRRREESRPFTPWTGKLTGEVTLWEGGLLSLSLSGEESRGNKKPCRVRWGDTWEVKEGAPCPPARLFQGRWGWKRALLPQLRAEGEKMVASGEHFFDGDWERRLPRWLHRAEVWLTGDRMEWALPPCAISPAAEGAPVFSLPREMPALPRKKRKKRQKKPFQKN